MFLRRTKGARFDTALSLTLRFAAVFILSGIALFYTANRLLERSQLERDQQLIDSFAESYQRLETQAGLHKLELVIARDVPYFQRSEMWVTLRSAQGELLMKAGPEHWQGSVTGIQALADGWFSATLSDGAVPLLMRQIRLESGARLRVARSELQRREELHQYRLLVLMVMLPLMGFGLLLTAYMNWRALRPVHDLIDTVSAIRANNLTVRVGVRNPDSELGELAQLFNDMLCQIERLVESMRHSLDAVAHDLRTPLSRMRLSVENALASNDEVDIREALLDCAEESERIETMLKALMDLTEAENGMLRLQPQSLNLKALLSDCVELYRYVADEKGIELKLNESPDLILFADNQRLRQVVCNLLDNAIKYTPSGGRVELGLENDGGLLGFYLRDSGIGIAAEDQPMVFDRLFRADQSRTEPGMGLGLALVRAVVEAHEGTINLQSELGQGSCFTIFLPSGNERAVEKNV